MPDTDASCEYFEILISAMTDGELDIQETAELNQHLENCSGCRQLSQQFANVDELLAEHSLMEHRGYHVESSLEYRTEMLDSNGSLPKYSPAPTKLPHRTRQSRKWITYLPLAVAATLLGCLILIAWPNPQPAAAGQLSPEEVIQPMQELKRINQQKQRDQEMMLHAFSLELRVLKLELNQLEPDSPERIAMSQRIDAMLERLHPYVESSNQSNTSQTEQ